MTHQSITIAPKPDKAPATGKKRDRALTGTLVASLGLAVLFWAKGHMPFMLGLDLNDQRCLPDVRAAILLKGLPEHIMHGDLVYFAPSGPLSYVKDPYVMKRVAGIPGDRLTITKAGDVEINGNFVVRGLPLAKLYHKTAAELAKEEIIPRGKYFVIGTHPLSDDSRYWGYISQNQILGTGHRLF